VLLVLAVAVELERLDRRRDQDLAAGGPAATDTSRALNDYHY
jgi:hypothetical protein